MPSRGALRIGAVLLEEARLFGGDTARIARSLAPIYLSLGDYRSLATLPASPLSPAEQKRVRWLVSHPSVLEFPDSAATLAYHSIVDGSGIGVLSLGIGDHRVDALIDPRASGVIVRGRAARRRDGLHTFGDDSSGVVAVVHELHIGDVTLGNVPARLISGIRDEVWAVDKEQPVTDLKTMDQYIADSVSPRRFNALLLAIFASLASQLA